MIIKKVVINQSTNQPFNHSTIQSFNHSIDIHTLMYPWLLLKTKASYLKS
jgi:hypothetical protein